MTIKGPPKTPSKIAALKGNPGHRPINDTEPQPYDGEMPEPPADLEDDEREVWDRMAPSLYKLGVLTEWDVDEFARYCRAHVRYIDAVEALKLSPEEGGGNVVDGAAGGKILNPLVHALEKAENQVHKLAVHFGMTPASRTKISAVPPKEKSSRYAGQKRA